MGSSQLQNHECPQFHDRFPASGERSLSLTRDEASSSYVIIRHNVRTYESAGVVVVVRGKQNAETELKKLEAYQSPADRHEGWRYFIEKTDLKAGMDPAEATRRRQTDLETRESNALHEKQ